jgi:hypothetical protein
MKPSTKTLFALSCAYAIATASSLAQIFTFDEFGNITMNGGPDPVPVPSQLMPDPSGGVTTSPVLVYTLPFQVSPGDVVLYEPNPAGNDIYSDVVRFWSPTGSPTSEMIFYSDYSSADPPDAPADTGLPTQLINPFFINEVGPEGNNGAVYTAAGGPGSNPAVLVTYNIISDVPEPDTLALIAVGAGLLLFTLKRRQPASVN